MKKHELTNDKTSQVKRQTREKKLPRRKSSLGNASFLARPTALITTLLGLTYLLSRLFPQDENALSTNTLLPSLAMSNLLTLSAVYTFLVHTRSHGTYHPPPSTSISVGLLPFFLDTSTFAQAQTPFVESFGNNGTEHGRALAIGDNGDIYINGNTNSFTADTSEENFVLRRNSSGSVQWLNRINSPLFLPQTFGNDAFTLTNNRKIVLSAHQGGAESYGYISQVDAITGQLEIGKYINDKSTRITSISVSPNGDHLWSGYTQEADPRALFASLDANMTLNCALTANSHTTLGPIYNMAQTSTNDAIIISDTTISGATGTDGVVAHVSKNCSLTWAIRIDAFLSSSKIARDSRDDIYLATWATADNSISVWKFFTNGTLLWKSHIQSTSNPAAFLPGSLELVNDNEPILIGTEAIFSADVSTINYIIHLAADGAEKKITRITYRSDGTGAEMWPNLAVISENHYVLSGSETKASGANSNILFANVIGNTTFDNCIPYTYADTNTTLTVTPTDFLANETNYITTALAPLLLDYTSSFVILDVNLTQNLTSTFTQSEMICHPDITLAPTQSPTPSPTPEPTPAPPTPAPLTGAPSQAPTQIPTAAPTGSPTPQTEMAAQLPGEEKDDNSVVVTAAATAGGVTFSCLLTAYGIWRIRRGRQQPQRGEAPNIVLSTDLSGTDKRASHYDNPHHLGTGSTHSANRSRRHSHSDGRHRSTSRSHSTAKVRSRASSTSMKNQAASEYGAFAAVQATNHPPFHLPDNSQYVALQLRAAEPYQTADEAKPTLAAYNDSSLTDNTVRQTPVRPPAYQEMGLKPAASDAPLPGKLAAYNDTSLTAGLDDMQVEATESGSSAVLEKRRSDDQPPHAEHLKTQQYEGIDKPLGTDVDTPPVRSNQYDDMGTALDSAGETSSAPVKKSEYEETGAPLDSAAHSDDDPADPNDGDKPQQTEHYVRPDPPSMRM